MSTYTITPQEGHHRAATGRTTKHPLASTVAALAGAVAVGVLVGVLFSVLFTGTGAAPQHRAGGHATATAAARSLGVAVAVDTTATTGPTVVAAVTSGARSPARGGFAVGRTAGAGSGFIVLDSDARAPVRGGFPGRSLGAGNARTPA
jgi:hypothetical protein